MTQEPKRFTYNGDPSVSDLAAVRFLLGDIDKNRRLLDDREIEYAVEKQGSVEGASILCATAIMSRFSSMADITIGPISKSYSRVAELMRVLIDELKRTACLNVTARFPATSYDGKRQISTDSDYIPGSFYVGMSDHPHTRDLQQELQSAGFHGY